MLRAMKVSVGPATIVGYGFSALAAGASALAASEGELSGPGKWLAILSAITAVTTNFGRQMQAKAAIAPAPAPEVLTDRPETGVAPEDPPPVAA